MGHFSWVQPTSSALYSVDLLPRNDNIAYFFASICKNGIANTSRTPSHHVTQETSHERKQRTLSRPRQTNCCVAWRHSSRSLPKLWRFQSVLHTCTQGCKAPWLDKNLNGSETDKWTSAYTLNRIFEVSSSITDAWGCFRQTALPMRSISIRQAKQMRLEEGTIYIVDQYFLLSTFFSVLFSYLDWR